MAADVLQSTYFYFYRNYLGTYIQTTIRDFTPFNELRALRTQKRIAGWSLVVRIVYRLQYSYFGICCTLNLNLHISQWLNLTRPSHNSKHVLCTLAMVPRQKHGDMHLFDWSLSGSKQILQQSEASNFKITTKRNLVKHVYWFWQRSEMGETRLKLGSRSPFRSSRIIVLSYRPVC